MIDIHCHILPGVDDGPKTIEKSLEMLKMAERDGIRKIVASPHFNHPLGFDGKGVNEAFHDLRDRAKAEGLSVELFLGAEQYISKEDMKHFNDHMTIHTISRTRFVLVEFKRHLDLESMLGIVHELKINGFLPIVAHMEVYPAIVNNADALPRLRNEGAFIQVNAMSITGALGAKQTRKILKSIAEGSVDYIASDAHGLRQRPPVLRGAYEVVSKNISESVAKQVFISNQEKLLQGGLPIKRSPVSLKRGFTSKVFAGIFAGLVILLVTAGMNLANGNNQDIKAPTEARVEVTSESIRSMPVQEPTTEVASANVGVVETIEVNEPFHELPTEAIPTKESIEANYEKILLDYKAYYESTLDQVVKQIQEVRSLIEDQEERNRAVDVLLDEIFKLEAESDKKVYDLLYDLQNDLEAYRYDIGKVQEFRDIYNQLKTDRENHYLSLLKSN